MVFIPPPIIRPQQAGKPANYHELAVAMFVVFVIMLCIALFIFIAGPRSNDPPPLVVGYAVSGIALIFGFIAFFAWMKAQSDGDAPTDGGSTTDREQ
jgi:drug/metabolite transporter (DMT)-like permease